MDEVLDANEQFYRAFRDADLDAMDRLWSRETDVACVHPGWPAVRGRERVMESWRVILTAHPPPQVQCARVELYRHGEFAFITCVERIPEVQSELVATNVFIRQGDHWRMVHHHSGPVRLAPDLGRTIANDDEPSALN